MSEEQLSLPLDVPVALETIKHLDDSLANVAIALSELMRMDLRPAEVAAIHDFTDKTVKSLDAFKVLARNRIEAAVKESGVQVTEKGTKVLDLGNGRVQRISPTSTKPNNKKVESLLRSKKLPLDVWMLRTVSYAADESKLKELMDCKLITEEDFKGCFGETTYRVGKSTVKGEDEDD